MIIKYDKKTGKVLESLPESKYKPPNTIGHVNVFVNGKRVYKKKEQIKTLMLEGDITRIYQDPRSKRKISNLIVKEKTDNEIVLEDKSTKTKFKGESITRYYTKIQK